MKSSAAIALLIVAALIGCVSRTTVRDEPRRGVTFADAATAQTFYDTYLRVYHPEPEGHVTVALPLPYHHVKRGSENVQFNAAVKRVDLNQDQLISAEEARAFAVETDRARDPSTQPTQHVDHSIAANAAP
ncbi:MAG TPA: hypothetical protein VER17_09015 [Tepidisphaeraceae bacterium]|nr:hypothetical protein [Tepidisphaeraceae bacterium]